MSTNTLPNQILIIRHGEKVGDPKKDDDGGRHLSVRGSARAAALPSLFSLAIPQLSCKFHAHAESFVGEYRQIPLKGTAPRFPTPNHIFATERSKHSNRPLETILPLATALNLPVYDSLKDDDAGINGARIVELCCDDWGLCRTITRNLDSVRDHLPSYEVDRDRAAARLAALQARIEAAPKSRGWRLRDKVGERKRWYELPEEVGGV